MIKLANGKPQLAWVSASNDMSHFFPSHWAVKGETFLVTDEMYLKMLWFTDPELLDINDTAIEMSYEEILQTSAAKRIEWAINLNPDKSQLWQFNSLNEDMLTFSRRVIAFGERSFILPKWSHPLKYKILSLVCHALNYALYFKNRRECADWQKYLEAR